MDKTKAKKPEARRHVTERCLIAADVDKTILTQTSGEDYEFYKEIARHLIKSADLGMKLAFVTGNSISELTNRLLRWLIEELCRTNQLALLPQFHFFCNSGGVYFHFSQDDDAIKGILKKPKSAKDVFRKLTRKRAGMTFVRPTFVDTNYLMQTRIPSETVTTITKILEKCGDDYYNDIKKPKKTLRNSYVLSQVMKETSKVLEKPCVEKRPVHFMNGISIKPKQAIVQLTLKPVLSFRHGKTEKIKTRLFGKDLRTQVIKKIQKKLDDAGLGHYVARPGGRSSIDVTLEKLNKAYAMEFLIDRLNLQGHERYGQQFGANAVYFGDEVIAGGGNDYAVTRIPGLLVFAVNSDTALVPFLSPVLVPSSILVGPEATTDVLMKLNNIAGLSLDKFEKRSLSPGNPEVLFSGGSRESAINRFKIEEFSGRIQKKIDEFKNTDKLTPDEWQALHTFITLMNRDDASARHWLAILIDELDAIMTQLSADPRFSQPAIGTSHADG